MQSSTKFDSFGVLDVPVNEEDTGASVAEDDGSSSDTEGVTGSTVTEVLPGILVVGRVAGSLLVEALVENWDPVGTSNASSPEGSDKKITIKKMAAKPRLARQTTPRVDTLRPRRPGLPPSGSITLHPPCLWPY